MFLYTSLAAQDCHRSRVTAQDKALDPDDTEISIFIGEIGACCVCEFQGAHLVTVRPDA